MTQVPANKGLVDVTSPPTTHATATSFLLDVGGIDLGGVGQARRRSTTQVPASTNATTFAERGAMLLPLLGLAACGGGGATNPPGPPPPPPTATFAASSDAATITVGAALTGATNVLANDAPATGATVTVVVAGSAPGTGTSLTAAGTLGSLTLTAAGAVTYTAGAGAVALRGGQTGTDVFTYTGAIGSATSSSQFTITVTGINDRPGAGGPANASAPVSGTAALTGLTATDPDTGDTLTIRVTEIPTGVGAAVSKTSGGPALAIGDTLTVAELGNLFARVGAAGTTPGNFSYSVTDAGGLSATKVVAIGIAGPVLNLTTLGTAQGTILSGAAGSGFGAAIAGGGDVNGDGRPDVVVGSPTAGNGAIQIFFGNAGAFSSAAAGTIQGNAAGDRFGSSVAISSAGGTSSINGDARADIIVGAPLENAGGQSDTGAAYIIFGNASLPTDVSTPSTGALLKIAGLDGNKAPYNGTNAAVDALSDTVGFTVYSPGDINGDGRADYIIGAPGAENGNVTNLAGQSDNDNGAGFVGYGQTTFASANLNPGNYTGASTIGTVIRGGDAATNEYFYGISAVGNFNGGTTSELAFASPTRDLAPTGVRTDNGVVYVESNFTQQGGAFNIATADFQIVGATTGDRLGTAIAFGDVNGDGFADLIIGAPGADASGTDSGAVYIVFGAATNSLPAGGLIDLNAITFTAGLGNAGGLDVVRIAGSAAGQGFGASVAFLGNFDGGGATSGDFAVGTNGGSGDAFVINGGTAASVAARSIAAPDGTNVLQLDGPTVTAGSTVLVANVGDVNGGGQADLGVGIGGANAAYIIYAKTASQSAAGLSYADTGLSYDSASVSVDQIVANFAGVAEAPTASLSGAVDYGIAMPMSTQDTMVISDFA
jgi:VCBS repeat-containing protein